MKITLELTAKLVNDLKAQLPKDFDDKEMRDIKQSVYDAAKEADKTKEDPEAPEDRKSVAKSRSARLWNIYEKM